MLFLDCKRVLLSQFQGASCLPGVCFCQAVSPHEPWGISAHVSAEVTETGGMWTWHPFPLPSSRNTANKLPAAVGLPLSREKELRAWQSRGVFPVVRALSWFSSRHEQFLGLSVGHAWPTSSLDVDFLQVLCLSNSFVFGNDAWWNLV